MGYTYKVDPNLIQSPRTTRTKIDPLNNDELQGILSAPFRFEYREDTKYRNALLIHV